MITCNLQQDIIFPVPVFQRARTLGEFQTRRAYSRRVKMPTPQAPKSSTDATHSPSSREETPCRKSSRASEFFRRGSDLTWKIL